MSKLVFPIGLNNREHQANAEQDGFSPLFDENAENGWYSGPAVFSCGYSFSSCIILVSSAIIFLNIFFLAGGSFLEVETLLLTPTLASSP